MKITDIISYTLISFKTDKLFNVKSEENLLLMIPKEISYLLKQMRCL